MRRHHAGVLVALVLLAGACTPVAVQLTDAEAAGGDVPGCPPLPAAGHRANDSEAFAPPPRPLAPSTHVPRTDGRAEASVRLARDILSWPERRAHTVAATGMTIHVHADGPIDVDADELERLATLPFDHLDTLTDPRMRALWTCYAQRAVVERELVETHVRIYLPSDPTLCLRDYAFRPQAGQRCDTNGVALPATTVTPRAFGRPLLHLGTPATLVVAPGEPSRRSSTLLHELLHHYDNAFGLSFSIHGRARYEQRAYYVQHRLLDAEEVRFPHPFG